MYSAPRVKTSTRQRNFAFHGARPWAVNLEQFAINSARQQFVSESVQRAAKDTSLQSWTITNTMRRCWEFFCDRGAVCKFQTYFLICLSSVYASLLRRRSTATTHTFRSVQFVWEFSRTTSPETSLILRLLTTADVVGYLHRRASHMDILSSWGPLLSGIIWKTI